MKSQGVGVSGSQLERGTSENSKRRKLNDGNIAEGAEDGAGGDD